MADQGSGGATGAGAVVPTAPAAAPKTTTPPEILQAQAIEDAMTLAAQQCAEEGITDPDVIRARKQAARDAVVSGG
jgi:hypothetical protein